MLYAISLTTTSLVNDRQAGQMLELPVSAHVQNVTMEGGLSSGQLLLPEQILILAEPLCLSSNRGSFAPEGTFDNVCSWFWSSQLGGFTGSQWVEARDADEHPTLHRTAPTTKRDQVSGVKSVTHS